MSMLFTLTSRNEKLLELVRDFAVGLGLTEEPASPSAIALRQAEASDDALLHLLTYVALSAAKTGTEPNEPLCRVVYRQREAASEVTLDLRIAAFDMRSAKQVS